MHLCQLEIITINFHAFYIMKNGTSRYDVTMTLIRQEKIGNIFFLKQHICFLKKNEYKSLLPKNAHGSPNFDKAACTNISRRKIRHYENFLLLKDIEANVHAHADVYLFKNFFKIQEYWSTQPYP